MRVLGIDPGLSRCGVGVVEGPRGKPVAVHVGVIRTAADTPMAKRLCAIFDGLTALLAEHRPDAVAVERVFFDRNVSTGIGVAQAAGLALVLAEQRGIPAVEYTPSEIKSLIAGDGAADKGQVGYMVTAQLGLEVAPKPADAADALAVALCHLQQAGGPGAQAPEQAGGPGAQAPEQAGGPGARAPGAASTPLAGGMSPRLAAAYEQASAGAQVVRRGAAR